MCVLILNRNESKMFWGSLDFQTQLTSMVRNVNIMFHAVRQCELSFVKLMSFERVWYFNAWFLVQRSKYLLLQLFMTHACEFGGMRGSVNY